MPLGLLDGEKMSAKDRREAQKYADELLDMSNDEALNYIDGTGGNVLMSYKSGRAIAIHLRNSLDTIGVLEKELRDAKDKEAKALQLLGAQMLEKDRYQV